MRRTLGLLGFAALLFATAARAAPAGLEPFDASVDGHRVDALLDRTHGFDAVLVLVFTGWMLLSVWRSRRREPAIFETGERPRDRWGVLAVAVGAFLVVDGQLFVGSLRLLDSYYWNFERAERDPEAVRVEVNAHQWAWDVRYAGADGQFGTEDDVVLWNELRIPTNAPVVIQLSATDVVHSLYLPNFRVKQDAIPGQINRLWFRAKVPGEYEIGCAQHCGVGHYRMRGTVVVMEPAAFKDWLKARSEHAVRGFDPDDTEAHWGWAWKALR